MKVRFTQRYQVKDARGKIYREGEVYDLPESTAHHFLKRKRAEIVIDRLAVPLKMFPTGPPKPPEAKKILAMETRSSVEEKELDSKKDPTAKFSEAQKKYRSRKLFSKDEDDDKENAT